MAVPASLVSVVATSLGGILHLYRNGLIRVGVAVFLETASMLGFIVGTLVAVRLPARSIVLLVALVLLVSALLFASQPVESERRPPLGRVMSYTLVWLASLATGAVTATTGIGGGALRTPLLTLLLGLGLKATIATSRVMTGATAAVGVIVHGLLGHVDLLVVVLLALGAYMGAGIGTRILVQARPASVKRIVSVIYVALSLALLTHTP